MTEALTPASSASSRFVSKAPGASLAAASSERRRAGVILSSAAPPSLTPIRGTSGGPPPASWSVMRNTRPRGASVQRAVQSTNSTRPFGNAGISALPMSDFRLGCSRVPSSLMAQTTPIVWRGPSGAMTRSPGRSASPGGLR